MAQHGTAHYGTPWHGMAHNGTAHHSTRQLWHGILWHATAHHARARHATAQPGQPLSTTTRAACPPPPPLPTENTRDGFLQIRKTKAPIEHMTSASRFSLSSYTPHPPVRITILYLANVSSHHHHRRRDAFWTSADAIYIPVKVQHWVPPPGAAHFLYCTPSSALCTMLRYTKSPTRLCPPPGGGAACFLFLLPSWKSLHSTPKYPMQGAGWAQTAPSLAPFPSPALGRGRAAPRPRSPPSATWGGAASFFCRVVLFVWVFFVLFFFFLLFVSSFS